MKNQPIILENIDVSSLNINSEYKFIFTQTNGQIIDTKESLLGLFINITIREKPIFANSICPLLYFAPGHQIVFKREKYGLKNYWIGKHFVAGKEQKAQIFLENIPEFIDIWEMKRNKNEDQD